MKLIQYLVAITIVAGCLVGCSDPSLKIAIQAQRRADDISEFIFQQQHDGLVMYLFRDLSGKLATGEEPLSDEQYNTLNLAWNERDLIEHWAIQHERAKALRNIGVNSRLYGEQSIIDLIGKSFGQSVEEQASDPVIQPEVIRVE